ncbi:MAG: hypothetical protein JNL65_09790 [Saprospiraceae bacterium]|nr:hypothetical protein [Saprospiraceae bacterium]HRG67331.1 hypothetical protein [Saprospiraceae bacterium]
MKKVFVFCSFIFATGVFAQVEMKPTGKPAGKPAQGGSTAASDQGSSSALAHVHCCPKIYLSTPSIKKGAKPATKLVSSNLFKGRNQGIDLTFDVLDPEGAVLPNGQSAISQNATGDIVIDAGKLAKGKKYSLRVKAGSDTETIKL